MRRAVDAEAAPEHAAIAPEPLGQNASVNTTVGVVSLVIRRIEDDGRFAARWPSSGK
jgi:hypothetical protein